MCPTKRSRFGACLTATKFLPCTSSPVYAPSARCALQKRLFWIFADQKSPKHHLISEKIQTKTKQTNKKKKKLKLYSMSFLRSALGLISKPTLKLSSGSPLAASVGLSLLGMALCVGDCAVCESQPPSRGSAHCFQPPLGCTTTLLFNGSSSDFCVNTQI